MKFHDDKEVQWEKLHEYRGNGIDPCSAGVNVSPEPFEACGAASDDDRVHLLITVSPNVCGPLGGRDVEEVARYLSMFLHTKRKRLHEQAVATVINSLIAEFRGDQS